MTDQFDTPVAFAQLDPNALRDQLVLIKPYQERLIPTKFGLNPATISDVHILTGPQAGVCHHNGTVWWAAIRGFMADKVGTGRFALGRFVSMVTREGNDAWRLSEATEEEKAMARRYLDSPTYQQNASRSQPPPPPSPQQQVPQQAPQQQAPQQAPQQQAPQQAPQQQAPWAAPQQQPAPAAAGNGDPWGAPSPATSPSDPWGSPVPQAAPAGPATPFGPESPF